MTEIGIADSERWAFEISNRMRKAKPSNLRADLGPKAFNALKSELEFRNIPTGGIDTLPPWIAIELIWGARCEFEKAYKAGAEPSMDWDLMLHARAQGVPERGIEGLNKSLNLFASADYSVQVALLRNTLEGFQTERNWITTVRAAQFRRETMVTEILSRRFYPRPDKGTPTERAAYDFWWDKIIVERNHFFVRRTKSELRRGGVVIAVGAMHLPTDDGMIELLRAEGFAVTRID